jgi:hypothetical protein
MLKVIGGVPDGEYKAIASGTLPNGKPVVVNSDGTVSVVGEGAQPETIGTPTSYYTGAGTSRAVVYDSFNDKFVFLYSQSSAESWYGAAVVGTVSGTSISFGTPVVWNSATTYGYISGVFDSTNNKIIVSFQDVSDGGKGKALVGTVSGTSISFGSVTQFEAGEIEYLGSAFDTNAGKVLLAYEDVPNSRYGTAIVGTVSGTSISFGSPTVYLSNRVRYISVTYDSNAQKSLVFYQDTNSSEAGRGRVATISGTSVSFGTQANLGVAASPTTSAFDSTNNKILVGYRNESTLDGEARVATISGTSVSFGSATVVRSGNTSNLSAAYDSQNEKFVMTYGTTGNLKTGTISGTTVSFGSEVTYDSSGVVFTNLPGQDTAFGNGVVVINSKDNTNAVLKGTVFRNAGNYPNLTAENYIGMSPGYVDRGSQSVGSESVFESASVIDLSATYDANAQKVVVAYTDNGNSRYGTAVVGTVSGTSITFGTPVVYESANTEEHTPVYDSNAQKIVIGYQDRGNSDYGTAIVGTVSGTSISFGSPQVFHSGSVTQLSGAFDSNNNKVVFAYLVNNSNGNAVVGTVSGTSVSFGSTAVFESGRCFSMSTVYDTNAQKIVISYNDNQDNNYGKSIVGTVSGTSISFGSITTFYSGNTGFISSVYDLDSQKIIVCYADNGNSSHGTAIVGTVSGTSISFGTAIVFNAASTQYTSATYDEGQNKLVVAYRDVGNSNSGTVIPGTVSGSSITFGDETVFNGSESNFVTAVYDAASGNSVISYIDNGNSDYGTSVVFQNAYDNSGSVADGDNARVDIIGSVSDNQIGLTAGEKYYVQTDGTLSTTAGSPSVLAGTAISATKLVVKT